MLNLSRNTRPGNAPRRDRIDTTPKYDRVKKRRSKQMSKRAKEIGAVKKIESST
jgi:hypothetical protein